MNSKILVALLVLALGGAVAAWALSGGAEPLPGGVSGGSSSVENAPGATLTGANGGSSAPEGANSLTNSRVAAEVGEEAGAGLAVRGRLIDDDGRPVADAELFVAVDSPTPGSTTLRASTDATGEFSFAVAAGSSGRLAMTPGDYLWPQRAAAPRFSQMSEDIDLGDLRVQRAGRIAGVVRDPAGRPIAGVQVQATSGSFLGLAGAQQASTAADGGFEIAGLAAGAYQLVTASPDFAPVTESVVVNAGRTTDNVALTLERGGSLRGRVVNDLGVGIAGAKVAPWRTVDYGANLQVERASDDDAATADADGYFELGGITGTSHRLRATADGHAEEVRGGIASDVQGLVFELARNAQVSGRVVDADGQPVADTRVSWQRADDSHGDDFAVFRQRQGQRTAADGAFTLEDVETGSVIVKAESGSHAPASQRIELRPGEVMEGVSILVDAGRRIVATVLDPEGAPVVGARVSSAPVTDTSTATGRAVSVSASFRSDGSDEEFVINGAPKSAITDANGQAVLGGLTDEQLSVWASDDESAPSIREVVTLNERGATEVTLSLRPAGRAEVLVTDSQGEPVVGTFVSATPVGEGGGQAQHQHTDASGRAVFEKLAPGEYLADVHRDRNDMVFVSIRGEEPTGEPFRAVAGETIELTLVESALVAVTGTLRDAGGPIGNGQVEIVKADDDVHVAMLSPPKARTNAGGQFEVGDLEPGSYTVRYGRADQTVLAEHELEVGPGGASIDLLLETGIVRLTAVDSSGQPIANAGVTLRRVADEDAPQRTRAVMMVSVSGGSQTMTIGGGKRVTTDAQGVAEINDVPVGTFTASIEHGDYVPLTTESIEVTRAQVSESGPWTLVGGGTVYGDVTAADGGQPQFGVVRFESLDGGQPAFEVFQGGSFRKTGLAEGRYNISVSATGNSGPTQEITVAAGQELKVDLTLP